MIRGQVCRNDGLEDSDMEKDEVFGAKTKVLNRDVIKYIAMITMMLNHIAHMFLAPETVLYEVFEDVGYFTAPVMCFFLVEGYSYTRSKINYGLRLLLFALISQIPFKLAFYFGSFNMIYTLLCCFLILAAMDKIENRLLRIIVCTLLVFATAVGDWPLIAPIYTILFYCSKGNGKKNALSFLAAYAMFVPFNAQNYVYGVPGDRTLYVIGHTLLSGAGILAAAVMILFFYNGKRAEHGRNFSKWFFYIFYPAHLMVLYLIKVYII